MGECEFRVSDKEPTTTTTTTAAADTTKSNNNNNTSSTSTSSCVLGSAVKLHKSLQNKMTRMLHHHHHNHNRPFDNYDDDGPTTYMSFTGSSSAPLGAPIDVRGGGAAAAVIRPLQPFHISAYSSATSATTLKSPAGGYGMVASLRFPFTTAQWKELQRQAMIYKYIKASVPVPSELLIPTTIPTSLDGGFNLRLSRSSTDPEPGRCRRTDGKKWRCAKDVFPNHKYCERHMHRGRPRSRKPVEVQLNNNNNYQIKKPRHDNSIPNPTMTTRKDGSSSQFLDNKNYFGVKGFNFGSVASVSSNKQPRGLEWMQNGDPISVGASSDSRWQSLMHNKVEMNTEPHYQLNSLPLYSSELDQQDKHNPMFFNPLVVPMEKPRDFIDAWSNADTGESNVNGNNKNSAASDGKLSLTSLDLSMGGGNLNEDMGTNGMGLGLMEPDGNTQHNDSTKISLSNWLNPTPPWVASSSATLGGPLAEVLRPSTVTTTSDATSNQSNVPLGTMFSSPSGVLHKTLASFSDSSDNSSPTVASSRANSEIPLLKFN